MTMRSVRNLPSRSSTDLARQNAEERRRRLRRHLQLEALENRHLMAVGPQLIGIQPNLGDLLVGASLSDGQYDLADVGRISVLNEAPNSLRLSFDESQTFATAGVKGIQVTRAGVDQKLGTVDDVTVVRSDLNGFTGFIGGDTAPNRNVVVLRFPETLSDDLYRVEIFGADSPSQNLVGLRNTTNDLFVPATAGDSSQKVDFKLSLGAQITAVVPQPVERVSGVLTQRGDRIDVYFNDDKLFPSAIKTGDLTPNPSVVRPEFYQLILTQGTARNTDDLVFNPQSVAYDPATNSARLTFASDLQNLLDPTTSQPIGYGTFRLRIGTNELTPTNPYPETPTHVSPTITGKTDFGSAGAVVMDFKAVSDFGEEPRIAFQVGSLGVGVAPAVAVNGQQITVTLNVDAASTAQDVLTAINGNPLSAALVFASIDPVTGGNPLLVLASPTASFAPVQLSGLGSSFATATDLGNLALANFQNQIISSSIVDSQPFALNFPSTQNEPGHRDLPDGAGNGNAQHTVPSFGYDDTAGSRTIFYNFKKLYGVDPLGNQLSNEILDEQKQRVREALELWANYVGVQFVETAGQGITFATGDTRALNTAAPDVRTGTNAVTRVDPNFTGSTIILSKSATWNNTFGQSYFEEVLRDIGWVLGLGDSPELPASNEDVYPNDQDVIHGQLLHHPDSNDVDMYRFTIDLPEGKTGAFTAQTVAERQLDSSLLDSVLRLYRETDSQAATVSTDFNSGAQVRVRFTAVTAGRRGNDLTMTFTQNSALGATVQVIVVDDAINVTMGTGITAQDVLTAVNNDPDAGNLVQGVMESGNAATVVSTLPINYSPLGFGGGLDRSRELIASNDDYFSKDSLIELDLGRGTYYLGVSAKGNETYDPAIENTGLGGRTSGKYDLKLNFRPQVDSDDTIRDQDRANEGVPGTPLDGDGDGVAGGVYDFWFQTQNLNRVLEITGGGAAFVDGQVLTITNFQGVVRRFEFNLIGSPGSPPVGAGNIAVNFNAGDTPAQIATTLAAAINGVTGFNSPGFATRVGAKLTLSGDRLVVPSASITGIKLYGKTLFVDKSAGPQADGSAQRPFNNISSSTVTNAFAAALPGDIVRIVGNGGTDGNLATVNDAFAYEIGFGTLPGQVLTDGSTMEVPKGVTVMVDAGAVFKLLSARIGVGSYSLGVDRSQGALQVLGTPLQSVYFTSWLDESIGRDTLTTKTVPGSGNWGGIAFKRDLDHQKGQFDLESQGIFLDYVNHADIRYGGGIVNVDSTQTVIQPIQMTEARPTITFNTIRDSNDSALSADPDSFAESDFNDPVSQRSGEFTPDYDRVGPEVHGNRLLNNSINGLFVRIATSAGGPTKILTKAGRFDDTDIVHYVAENLEIRGTPGGPILEETVPSISLVSLANQSAGSLAAGTYQYRFSFVDASGYEGRASAATAPQVLGSKGAIKLSNLPQAASPYVARRLYRSDDGGVNYKLIVELNANDQTYVDDDTNRTFLNTSSPTAGTLSTPSGTFNRPRLDASLVVDPGTVLKLEGARFEATFGAQFTAEGLVGQEIVFTSSGDDRFGAGGTFDTNNDDSFANEPGPSAGNWGGIYLGHTSAGSIDHALLAYGGGVNKIEGTFTGFNVLEVHQADLRLAHSSVENNASGVGGQAGADRLGRMTHVAATIFVRGAQPVLIDNVIRDNASAALQIDLNSLNGFLNVDPGRRTGDIDRESLYDNNRGPLIRDNRLSNNGANGMVVRPGTLAVEGVWDDTDIVHVVPGTVTIPNFHTYGGLRLESSPTESLVVKFSGGGITATGTPLDIDDRIGGMLHVVGQPGYPVVLTSLNDDTVGAGVQPDGTPMLNTDNSANPTIGRAADWNGLLLDRYSHDRNLDVIMETELSDATAPGTNATPATAQELGALAKTIDSGDNVLRLGFTVHGYVNDIHDVDTYSFTGTAGTEVWFDVDRTTQSLDTVLEVLNSDGVVVARSDDSTAEAADPSLLYVNPIVPRNQVNPLPVLASDEDFWTLNTHDAGMRVVLPGTPGARSTFFFRIRSAGDDIELVDDGTTAGAYDVQVRLRPTDELPGSTIRYADVRYTVNGIRTLGLPAHSPLTGEIGEDEVRGGPDSNDVFVQDVNTPGIRPQDIGNLLATDTGTLSIAGTLSSTFDLDVYSMNVAYVNAGSTATPPLTVPTVFDIDYADGLTRPDTTVSVFDAFGRLILIGRDSNILDDQPRPLSGNDMSDLGRGSAGQYDAFIGPVALPVSRDYFTVVSNGARIPDELVSNPLVRLEPIDSVTRIAEDHIGTSGGSTAFPPQVPVLLDPSFTGVGSNLWHVTTRRQNDPGHGLTPAFDGSRVAGAGTVTEQEPNDSLPGASDLDLAQWSLVFDANVGSATVNTSTTIPHVRINATGNGSFDYYKFSVAAALRKGIFDIDGGSTGQPGTVDTQLFLYDLAGNLLASNDTALTTNGSGGSTSTLDPFLEYTFATAGTYVLGVARTGSIGSPGGITGNPLQSGDQYTLQVSIEGHPLPPINTGGGQSFYFGQEAAGNYNIGSQAVGSLLSNPFNLGGYSAADLPKLYFNYFLQHDATTDRFRVFARDAVGTETLLASSLASDLLSGSVTQLLNNAGGWRQARIPLDAVAGLDGVRLRFEFDSVNNVSNSFEGAYIDDVVIGFAERGEMVTNAGINTAFTNTPGGAGSSVNAGEYQLEIRRGEVFGTAQIANPNTLRLDRDFDTNDRLTRQTTVTLPAGAALVDGATFIVGDGVNQLTFEFDRDGSVVSGNVAVTYTPASGANEVAAAFRDVLNSPAVQGVLSLQATSAGGTITGTSNDGRVALHGKATVTPGASGVTVESFDGQGDSNVARQQGEVLIQSNYVTEARDFGIWVDAGSRDPDADGNPLLGAAHPGSARNLRNENDDPSGGLTPGVVIENNVVSGDFAGGVHVSGDAPAYEIVTRRPVAYPAQGVPFQTAGDSVCDGDAFTVNSYRLSVTFEFEDIAGSNTNDPATACPIGSGTAGGNGWTPGRIPIFYRRTLNNTTVGFNQVQMADAINTAINGSLLVDNGTTLFASSFTAGSRLFGGVSGPDPAIYLDHASQVFAVPQPGPRGPGYREARISPIQRGPQPFARVVNNTIYGNDGSWAFSPESNVDTAASPNDTLTQAIDTHQGRQAYPQAYVTSAAIGDGPFFRTDLSVDVDFYQFQAIAGDRVLIDVDASSQLDGILRLFDESGNEIAFNDNALAPGEVTPNLDPFLDFFPTESGTYYVAVSARGNRNYDALSLGSRTTGGSTGTYDLNLTVRSPRNWYVNVDPIYAAGATFTISNLFTTTSVTAAGVAMPPGPPQFATNLANAINASGSGASARVVGRTWVLISGAVNVSGLAGIVPGPGENRHHVIQQEAIYLSEQSSPTMLNNVLVNNQNGLFQSQNSTTPFGTAISPFTAVEAASVYQFNATNSSITSSASDFNSGVANNVQLFVNAPNRDFYPAVGSPIIDSAIDSLQDRDVFLANVKQPMGLIESPILSPTRDLLGQLRVDDPNFDSPLAQGADVFKDRGALDRADFVAPRAVLIVPQDNDAQGVDVDPAETYVRLNDGSYGEFTILIRDGFTADNPFPGASVVDSTILTSPKTDVEGSRTLSLTGPAITVFQDGQLLLEGYDYRYRFDSISNSIQIISLAGVWPKGSVFEVKLNNKDRYVIDSPAGDQIADGASFTITDDTGARVTFEYDSGYRMVVGPTLAFQVPAAGTAANGIADGQKFTINDGKNVVTFEFDNNGAISSNVRRVAFVNGATVDQLAQAVVDAINLAVTQGALVGLQPRNLGKGLIHVGATPSTSTSVTSSALVANVVQYPTGLVIPAAGIGPGGIADGETFTITNGGFSRTFEFDGDSTVTAPNIPITFLPTDTLDNLADTIALQINSTPLGVGALNQGKGVVAFTTSTASHTVDVSGTKLERTMFIGGVNDGQIFSIQRTGFAPTTFEFQKDSLFVDANNDLVPDNHLIAITPADTQDDIADKIVAAIESFAGYLDPVHFGAGNIQVDDTTDGSPFVDYVVDVSGAPTLTLSGAPSVQPGTTLQLPVSAALEVPAAGGAAIADGEKFTVTNFGSTVVFEFDNNGVFQDLDNDSIPDNQIVPFTTLDLQNVVATTLVTALGGAGLGLAPQNFGNGVVSLGGGTTATIDLDYLGLGSSLTQNVYLRGLNDGDWFAIDDGTRTQTFEFENSLIGNGVVAGRTPVFFAPRDLADDVANSTVAVLVSSGLCTNDGVTCLSGATNLGGGRVLLGDSGRHITTLRPVTALSLSGVPAGAIQIPFQPDASFSDSELASFLIDAVNSATTTLKLTNVSSSSRGGSTVFVDFLTAAGAKVDFTQSTASVAGVNNFYLQAIQDLAGNSLRTNRSTGETQFTILMPGVTLDYGDAPDPYSGPGRYPTLAASDGARHTIGLNVDGSLKTPILGAWIDADGDGQSGAPAQGDDTDLAIDLSSSPGLSQSGTPGDFTIQVGDAGFGVPNVADAQTFMIFDGTNSATIEFDSNLAVTDGRTVVKFTSSDSIAQVGAAIAAAIGRTGLSVKVTDLGGGQVRVTTNDDDGVQFHGLFNQYLDTPIDVTVTAPAGWDGEQFLDGWIDFNQDGDWEDAGEQVFASRSVSPGVNSLVVRTTAGAAAGPTIARFRLSTTGALLPTGLAVGGEVEDYRVTIVPGVPPVAVNDPTTGNVALYSTTEDSLIAISAVEGLLSNDSDADSPPASLQVSEINGDQTAVGNLFTLPSGATVLVQADGSFAYDPSTSAALNALAQGVTANDTFTYRLTDGVLPSNLATVTIVVTGVNDAPSARTDLYTTDEDTVKSGVNVIMDDTGAGADTDADQGAFAGTVSTLRLTKVNGVTLTGTSDMTVTLASGAQVVARYNTTTGQFDGGLAYDPRTSASLQALTEGGAPGTDVFTYEIADSLAATSTGTVTLTVTGVNDAPVARPNNYATDEDTTLSSVNMVTNDTGAGADVDPDAGETATLTVSQIDGVAIVVNTPRTLPSGSILTLTSAAGNFTYQPGPAFNSLAQGGTQNDTFTYTVIDAHGAASIATVTVTVGGVNDGPTARTNIFGTDENTPLTGRNMIANDTGSGVDSDPDAGDVLSMNAVNGTAITGATNVVRTLPSGATLTILYNSTLGRFDGQFIYDASTSTTLNALNVGQTGQDTFTYSIQDALNVVSNVTTVTLTVAGANDAPIATPNNYATNEDTALTGPSAVNVITDPTADSDPDTGDTALLNVVAVNGVSGNVGTTITTGKGAALRITSTGAMTYDPTGSATLQALAQGGTTTDTFTYTVSDNRGGTSTATVTVTVSGLNDAPIARTNSYATDDNTSTTGKNVITDPTADSDPDSGETATLVVSAVNGVAGNVGVATTSAKGAAVTITASGALVYDPTVSATLNALQVGQSTTDTFTYTIKDVNNSTSTATVTFTVSGANDPPQARNNNYSVSENATLTGQNIITDAPADTDADTGDTLRVSAINGVSASVGSVITTTLGATLQVTSTGALTYNPTTSAQLNALTTGDTRTETFVYTLADARNATSTATVTITINGVNDAPIANNDSVTVIQATTTTINVLANDTDAEGPLTVPGAVVALVAGSGPSHGELTLNANGSFTYTPNMSSGPGVPDYTGPDSFQYRVTDSQGETSAVATVSINVTPVPSPFQNPDNNLDVNNDTFVSPIDALHVINFLNVTQQSNPTPPAAPPYLDVDGDRFVAPNDALQVINFLNGSGGEGEAATADESGADVGFAGYAADWGVSSVYIDHRWQTQSAQVVPTGATARPALADVAVLAADEALEISGWSEDWSEETAGAEEAADEVWTEWGAEP